MQSGAPTVAHASVLMNGRSELLKTMPIFSIRLVKITPGGDDMKSVIRRKSPTTGVPGTRPLRAQNLVLGALATIVSCGPSTSAPAGPDALFQPGTFSQLLAGDYRGIWSFAEIKPRGNSGLGTFEGIDGELVADGGY